MLTFLSDLLYYSLLPHPHFSVSTHIQMLVAKWCFCKPIIPFTSISWHSTVRISFSFPLICLRTYLCQFGLSASILLRGSAPHLSSLILALRLRRLGQCRFLWAVSVPSWHSPLFALWHNKVLQAHPICSWLVLKSAVSPKSLGSLSGEWYIKIEVWPLGELFCFSKRP